MTASLAATAAALLEPAATAAAGRLALDEAVNAVSPAPGDEADFAGAVFVGFSGALTGEIAIAVDSDLVASFGAASGDLAVALRPALDAIAGVLGGVALGVPQAVDPRLAEARVANHADTGTVVLRGATAARASVALGIDAPVEVSVPPGGARGIDRLDLLRGVEMQASAELGRARLTIDELLSLQTGAVVELDRAAGDPADLYVNGRLIARGEVVVVDENYALRITQIITGESGR